MYSSNEWARIMMEQERKLIKEVSSQPMSWRKLGKMIQLSALIRSRGSQAMR